MIALDPSNSRTAVCVSEVSVVVSVKWSDRAPLILLYSVLNLDGVDRELIVISSDDE